MAPITLPSRRIGEPPGVSSTCPCRIVETSVQNPSFSFSSNLIPTDIERAAEYQRALEREEDTNQWGTLNWRFHEALYRPAKRPRTLSIVANINRHVDRLLRLQMSLVDGKRKSRREHGALLAACSRGETEKAVSLLEQHIRGVEAIILRFVSNQSREG
jgi:DNA-binding GntR family transcriptional regulator